jgi:hypothetical protein
MPRTTHQPVYFGRLRANFPFEDFLSLPWMPSLLRFVVRQQPESTGLVN